MIDDVVVVDSRQDSANDDVAVDDDASVKKQLTMTTVR